MDDSAAKYDFLKQSRQEIDGVDDLAEWRLLKVGNPVRAIWRIANTRTQDALEVVGFSTVEQFELFRIPALILHIGNLTVHGNDQAFLSSEAQSVAERVCYLLGVSVQEFTKTVLHPKVRAGREWVTQARTKKQAEDELGALCKFMYEKTFGRMVDRINTALDRPSPKSYVTIFNPIRLLTDDQVVHRCARHCGFRDLRYAHFPDDCPLAKYPIQSRTVTSSC